MRLHHAVFAVLALAAGSGLVRAQPAAPADPNAYPNPYHEDAGWAKLDRRVGGTSAVDMDPDGKSVWIFERCGTPDDGCSKIKTLDPVMKFDASGKLVKHWGAGQILYPHGIFVGKDHHVWLVEGISLSGVVADVIHEYTEDGKLLRTLGARGTTGYSTDRFNGVSDVLVAPDGSIFVADGHSDKTNNRILKYDRKGNFIHAWGRLGTGPGEFNCPHGLALDAKGRLYVADRSNNRIQIFDQNGKFLEEWKQFGRPSGIYIRGDMIYVADSLSSPQNNPDFRNGIRWGHISTGGKVEGYLPWGEYNAIEAVAVDAKGNIFAGFTNVPNFRRFVRN